MRPTAPLASPAAPEAAPLSGADPGTLVDALVTPSTRHDAIEPTNRAAHRSYNAGPRRSAASKMKLNIACPSTGAQKWVEVDDEKKLRALYDNRIGAEVEGEALGEEFNGYVFRISGGNDKQGFPMKQGVLCNHRVKLLLRAGASCYRQRRSGERKRKSVRGAWWART